MFVYVSMCICCCEKKLKWKIKASRKEYVKSIKYKAIVFLGA